MCLLLFFFKINIVVIILDGLRLHLFSRDCIASKVFSSIGENVSVIGCLLIAKVITHLMDHVAQPLDRHFRLGHHCLMSLAR